LTEEEESEAAEHALAKSLASRGVGGRGGPRAGKGTRVDSVAEKTIERHREADLLGARGEKAWSVFWGVEWPKHIDDFKTPDFPPNIEIRTTRLDPPMLVLRARDMQDMKRDRRFVLISETSEKTMVIHGWVRPSEVETGFRPRRLFPGDRGKPARFIPVWSLHRFPFYSKFPKKHRRIG
jgi:hypothetical protein